MPPHRIYVEVFGGAANLLLNKAPSPIEVYYDIDGELVNLFLAVWDRPEDFAECFRLVLYSRGLYRRWFNGKQWYKCTQWVAGPEGFEPSTFELRAKDFEEFLRVDLQKSPRTARDYVGQMRRFFKSVEPPVTVSTIREFLSDLQRQCCPDYYAFALSALRAYFRDYRGQGRLVEGFRFPSRPFRPKRTPSKEDLVKFYYALEDERMKAIFLMLASTGMRRGEALSLRKEDVDFEKRMVTPSIHSGNTKHSWATFYGQEAEEAMQKYLKSNRGLRQVESQKLFPISLRDFKRMWKRAREKSSVDLVPKMLRDWFCNEMGELGVGDRYIDAFCGRVPKTILARHYTDFKPERLKLIYDKAGLKVLN